MSNEENASRIQISLPSFNNEEYEAIKKPLDSGWITQGKFVHEFEELFAEKHDVKYAVATTSCTTALHLMLLAAGIGPGDEVIIPSFTWVATANAVIYCGATPVLADIDLNSFNISLEDTLKKITVKTKAVVVVHLFGLCVDVEYFRVMLPEKIKIFEDAACAAGGKIKGKMAGSLGEAAAFSFHPRKTITTGEGGMITTNNTKIAELARKLRNHGAEISEEERHYGPAPYILPDFKILGFNFRMTDLQAAIGITQLNKLDNFLMERSQQAHIYQDKLKELTWLRIPQVLEDAKHAWQAYVLLVENRLGNNFRNQLMRALDIQGIATRPGTHAIHLLDFYSRNFHYKPEDFPNSLIASENSIAIPLHNRLTKFDQEKIISALKDVR